MSEKPVTQSSPRRAWEDTEHFRHSTYSFWGFEIVGASVLGLCGGYIGFLLTPMNATPEQVFLYPGIGGVVGVIAGLAIVFGGIYLWNLFRAPYKQRDEARGLVEELIKPSDSEVNDAIQQLQAEKLELKNDNEEERSYSFAQVFLAIADQLSIGISSIYFEETVKKELAMNANEGWYLPHEDKGITHLIGVLHQNTLIDRSNEEHQRLVPDYSQGDFSQGITVFTKPKWLPEKGIEAKYCLSPFGRRVIQQLQKQPTSHKEGSQT